jgi:hypothetical protein
MARSIILALAAAACGVLWAVQHPEPAPPTLIAEGIAYRQFGDICPRDVPRSDVCRALFAEVERNYLASIKP